jgi:hypothetical protein
MTYEESQLQAGRWKTKLENAERNFKTWEDKFRCHKMDDYYEGLQWENDPLRQAFVMNVVYATTQIKIATLAFDLPQYQITPRPGKASFDPDEAYSKCLLATDTLNTLVCQTNMHFAEQIEQCLLDSFPYFGVLEVGYDAKWRTNPNAGKPVIATDYDATADPEKILREPAKIPESEWIYVKRIPADRFRVGTNDVFQLDRANWVAYWEYFRVADLKDPNSGFEFTDEIEISTLSDDPFTDEKQPNEPEELDGMIKGWKIWDLRAKIFQIVFPRAGIVSFQRNFKRLPIFGLKYSNRRHGWYPIPLSSNWQSPQDEINECKEQLRTHRRRSKRVFQVNKGAMEPEEKEKLVNGPDGVVIERQAGAPIEPINNTPVDQSVLESMHLSESDFDKISGVTSQERGQADRTTATEIQTINARSQIRETKEQARVATWLCQIGREILLQAIEKLSDDIWVKRSVDDDAFGAVYDEINANWQKIKVEWLENLDFDVKILVSSLSPLSNEDEMNAFMRFLSLITQFQVISLSPTLIRETAYRCNYRNEKVIRAMQQAAQLSMIGQIEMGKSAQQLQQQQAMMAAPQPGGGNPAQRTVAQMQPPNMGQIQNQIQQQQMPSGPQGM